MSRKLSMQELVESDVILVMRRSQFDALPARIYEQLRLYMPRERADGKLEFRIPAYLYRQMNKILA